MPRKPKQEVLQPKLPKPKAVQPPKLSPVPKLPNPSRPQLKELTSSLKRKQSRKSHPM